MRKELLEQLIERFPYIQNKENIGLQWGTGVDCGDGWYNLINELLEKIEEIYKINNKDIKDFKILHIKEKFGELRVYVSTEFLEVHRLITEYENLSAKICENCGKEGNLYNKKGYLLTLCGKCSDNKGFMKV